MLSSKGTARLSPLFLFATALAVVAFIVIQGAGRPAEAAGAAASYEARSSNSISGLTDVSQLSNPMAVRYDEVMEATEERVRMRKEKIDPTSPLGEILESAAHRRVSAACRAVMRRDGHCSAWKKIKRKDGRAVPDTTTDVIAKLGTVTPDPE
ncbi:hypothetical protein N9Z54_03185 [Planctomycetota bacterium]|jgi:hypothetical protein|nr:hypothetical protein [Planctomycetota bacterium]